MDNATLMWNNFYSTLIRYPCLPQIVLSTSRMRSMVSWLGSPEVEHIISHRCQWNKKGKVTQLDRGLGYTHSRYRVLETSLTEGESKTIAHSVPLTGIHEASFHPVPTSIRDLELISVGKQEIGCWKALLQIWGWEGSDRKRDSCSHVSHRCPCYGWSEQNFRDFYKQLLNASRSPRLAKWPCHLSSCDVQKRGPFFKAISVVTISWGWV